MHKRLILSSKMIVALRIISIFSFSICAYYFFVMPVVPRWAWALLITGSLLNFTVNLSTTLNKHK